MYVGKLLGAEGVGWEQVKFLQLGEKVFSVSCLNDSGAAEFSAFSVALIGEGAVVSVMPGVVEGADVAIDEFFGDVNLVSLVTEDFHEFGGVRVGLHNNAPLQGGER